MSDKAKFKVVSAILLVAPVGIAIWLAFLTWRAIGHELSGRMVAHPFELLFAAPPQLIGLLLVLSAATFLERKVAGYYATGAVALLMLFVSTCFWMHYFGSTDGLGHHPGGGAMQASIFCTVGLTMFALLRLRWVRAEFDLLWRDVSGRVIPLPR